MKLDKKSLKYVIFFENLTETAYQIVRFRQIIKTVRVFDEFFVKFIPSYQSGVRLLDGRRFFTASCGIWTI